MKYEEESFFLILFNRRIATHYPQQTFNDIKMDGMFSFRCRRRRRHLQ